MKTAQIGTHVRCTGEGPCVVAAALKMDHRPNDRDGGHCSQCGMEWEYWCPKMSKCEPRESRS
jgi:hypothetical protein